MVDDDPNIIKILEHSLVNEGIDFVSVSNGLEALEKIERESFDLVLLDIVMPGIDGYETFQRLRTISGIPVIILTSKDSEVDIITGLRMGVDDYQIKPFSPMELTLRIKAVLRRTENKSDSEAETISAGNLEICKDNHMVKIEGEKIELTPKEFDLLWVLASRPEQVFTKLQILALVWQSTYFGDENTVMVHIRRLREKIEEDPSQPKYIKTVWGIGYKFVVD